MRKRLPMLSFFVLTPYKCLSKCCPSHSLCLQMRERLSMRCPSTGDLSRLPLLRFWGSRPNSAEEKEEQAHVARERERQRMEQEQREERLGAGGGGSGGRGGELGGMESGAVGGSSGVGPEDAGESVTLASSEIVPVQHRLCFLAFEIWLVHACVHISRQAHASS